MLPGWAASLTARLPGASFNLGETIVLELVFDGGTPKTAPQINVPGLGISFSSTRQFQQNINGQETHQFILIYQMTPQRVGTFTIPPITALAGNQQVVSAPVQFTVNQFDPALANQPAFVLLQLPKTNLYVGELTVFTADVYAIAEQEGAPELTAPGFTPGQWLRQGRQVVNLSGRNFARYNYVSYVVPAAPGQLGFGPVRFAARLPAPNARRTIFGDIVDWTNIVAASKTVPVTVLPLPATNMPPHFTGAVGAYAMTVTATPTNVAIGDPVTVKIEFSGNGLLDSLRLPEQPAWKEFKVYPATGKMEGANQLGLGGRKTFEQVVVPQSTEVRELPAFQFSYFDSAAGAYRTLASRAFPLIVRPSGSAQPIGPAEETNRVDIVPIKPQPGNLALAQAPLLQNPAFLAIQLVPVAAWLALLLRRRHLDNLAANPRLRRRIETDKAIADGLAELSRLASPSKREEFFAAVFRLLQERLGERLDLPATAITESVIEERLRPAGVDVALLKDLAALFEVCNQARYAPASTVKEFEELAAKTRQVLAVLAELKLEGTK
jgi:hypothetical protein